ncbi:MAG: hypothetical protein HGA53_03300 [Anaerolineaceae bacterium]|nr:hypothetical protein [Anaerolineaceae bacterium]
MVKEINLKIRLNELFSGMGVDEDYSSDPFGDSFVANQYDQVKNAGALNRKVFPDTVQPISSTLGNRKSLPSQFSTALTGINVTENTAVGELPLLNHRVDISMETSLVDDAFQENPGLVGVMVYDRAVFKGVISRRKFYEMMGKQFGFSIFLKRPIGVMLSVLSIVNTKVNSTSPIATTVNLALERSADLIYEPILIEFSQQEYLLLDVNTLLLAQASLFAFMQEQVQFANIELEERVQIRTHELQQENAERRLVEDMLKVRLDYEKTLTQCANTLLTGDDSHEIVNETLKYLISAVGVSNVFILRNEEIEGVGACLKLTYQLNAKNVEPIPDSFGVLPHQILRSWIESLWSGKRIIGHIEKVGPSEKEILQKLGFESILLIPIGEPGKWIGVIGFGETTFDRFWDDNDIELLFTVAQMLYSYFERRSNAMLLAQARDEALRASQFKSDLLAKVSHELRTPLSAVLGYAQLLHFGSYGELSEEQKEATDVVIGSTKYLSILVNGILDQAQLDSGQLVLVNEAFNLKQMATEVESRIRVLSESKGLDFKVQFADDLPENIFGDRMRVEQILTNLLGNSVKFTDAGEIGMNFYMSETNHLCIAVYDTGAGIPEDSKTKIFEPFKQVEDSYTRRYSGTGLGLSISKRLVEMMDGRILLESEIGKGSIFTVELPILTAQAIAKESG